MLANGGRMNISIICAACGSKGSHEDGFEPRGKYNGNMVVKCLSCQAGLLIANAGRALITKKAKTKVIESGLWARMTAEWDKNFPAGSY